MTPRPSRWSRSARWRKAAGRSDYPAARRLLITADAGGSNGYRTRAWKAELAALAVETGLEVIVCHFPPGPGLLFVPMSQVPLTKVRNVRRVERGGDQRAVPDRLSGSEGCGPPQLNAAAQKQITALALAVGLSHGFLVSAAIVLLAVIHHGGRDPRRSRGPSRHGPNGGACRLRLI
jgi:hypothetical protein